MCHSRAKHSIINRLRERCLRILYSQLSFEELLEKDFVSIDNRSLQFLAIEMYKVSNSLPPPIITELFGKKE